MFISDYEFSGLQSPRLDFPHNEVRKYTIFQMQQSELEKVG